MNFRVNKVNIFGVQKIRTWAIPINALYKIGEKKEQHDQ